MTKILPCNCVNAYQDEHYGKGNRVMNGKGKDPDSNGYRCTVCSEIRHKGSNVHIESAKPKKEKKKKEKKG